MSQCCAQHSKCMCATAELLCRLIHTRRALAVAATVAHVQYSLLMLYIKACGKSPVVMSAFSTAFESSAFMCLRPCEVSRCHYTPQNDGVVPLMHLCRISCCSALPVCRQLIPWATPEQWLALWHNRHWRHSPFWQPLQHLQIYAAICSSHQHQPQQGLHASQDSTSVDHSITQRPFHSWDSRTHVLRGMTAA